LYKNITEEIYHCSDKEQGLEKEVGLTLPNVFTPNGDMANDRFKPIPVLNHTLEKVSMTIYDRWGNQLAYIDNGEVGWDGKINGLPASAGVYFATVEYSEKYYFFEKEFLFEKKEKGFFHLFR
jgi:gliding motility-associated-like protein